MASYLQFANQQSQANLQRLAQLAIQREQMQQAAERQAKMTDVSRAATGTALSGVGAGVTPFCN